MELKTTANRQMRPDPWIHATFENLIDGSLIAGYLLASQRFLLTSAP